MGAAAQQQQQQRAAQASAAAAQDNRPCPAFGWQYVDPKGNVQGPFDVVEMQQWNQLGYFKNELKMRCYNEMEFTRFDVLFPPATTVPFQGYPRIPPSAFKAGFQPPAR